MDRTYFTDHETDHIPCDDLPSEQEFEFHATLDSEKKQLQSLGIGAKKCQAEPLTEEEEEQLW